MFNTLVILLGPILELQNDLTIARTKMACLNLPKEVGSKTVRAEQLKDNSHSAPCEKNYLIFICNEIIV